jgi:hypothetical protein
MFDTAVDKMHEEAERDPAQSVENGLTLRGIGRRRGRETIGPDGQPILSSETDIDHRLAPAREVAEAHALIRRRPATAQFLTFGTTQDGSLTITPVDNSPEAARAQQDANRIIIEGRLAAQTRRGIPEHLRAPITRAEATQLLSMPARVADDTEFRNLMRSAVDRADALYGPYARQALQSAIRFRSNVSNEQAAIAESAVRSLVNGTRIPAEEVVRNLHAAQLSREEQAWMGGTVGPGGASLFPAPATQSGWFQRSAPGVPLPSMAPDQVDDQRARMAMRRAAGLDAPASQPSRRPAAAPQPPPEEVQYLMQNPRIWREFDRDYGPGTAARYLQNLPQP